MSKRLFKTLVAVLAIAATAMGPARAQTNTVGWEKYQLSEFNLMQGDRETLYDVTITCNDGSAGNNGGDVYFNGAFTFSVPAGSVLTQIVIRNETSLSVDGWSLDGSETQATWTGSARSVACQITASNAQSIEFTIAPVAPKMYTSNVSITDLVPGDTLVEGATIIGSGDDDDMVFLGAGRAKANGVVQSYWTDLFLPPTVIGTNGTISKTNTYTPVDENGQDGDAWVVTDARLNDNDGFEVGLGGIRIPGPPHTVRFAAGTEDAANWSLSSGNASVPGTQVLENVMSGSQVTATYNGTTKKVKSVKAVKFVAVQSIVLDKQTASLGVDSTMTLSVASVLPENAADKSYSWSSDDIAVADVDQNGVVIGHNAGTANIIATANDGSGAKDTCVVTVLSPVILDGVTVLYASDYDNWPTVMGYNPGLMYQDDNYNMRLTSNDAVLFYLGYPVHASDYIYPPANNDYQWMLEIDLFSSKFYYRQGETWQEAIDVNRQGNEYWSIGGGQVKYNNDFTLVDNNNEPVAPTAPIDPSVNYNLIILDN